MRNFDKSKYPNTTTRIIDNGNQNIEGFQLYQLDRNIGCSGGFNLICYIGFQYLGLEKIIIGQEDTIPEESELQELLDKYEDGHFPLDDIEFMKTEIHYAWSNNFDFLPPILENCIQNVK